MKSGSQKLKKFLAFVMTAVMVLTAVPLGGLTFSASAEDGEYTEGYYTYTVENGEATITDCDESISGEVVIPDTLGGYPVTSIGSWAFYHCTGLTSITIPDSVTSIGYSAFSGCTGLTNVTIPDGVTSIGNEAFERCTGLTSITVSLGNTVYHSTDNCLIETESKTLILGCKNSVIPSDGSVTSIGDYAFYGCTGLTSITIPDSVTSIGDYAFYGCGGLTSITIPDGVTSIGHSAFSNCIGLTDIKLPKSLSKIDKSSFECSNLHEISIPEGVEIIAQQAFQYCENLKSVYIPSSVTSMSGSVFKGCSSLESLVVSPENSFYRSVDNCIIEIKTKTLIVGCAESIIPSDGSVTRIAGAFDSRYKMTDMVIPDTIEEISSNSFEECYALTSITIPNSVTFLGGFPGCVGLTNITIPDSVITIGSYAFCWCRGLKNVTIGKNVESIENFAFYDCPDLTSVTIPKSVTNIEDYAFGYFEYYGEQAIETKKIPNFTIYGYTGTAAETYANENGFAFIALDEEHTHTYSDWVVTTEPTCTAEGEETRTCSVCGAEETRPVERKAHDLNNVKIDSTCTVAGVSYDVCSECQQTFNYVTLPLAAHTFGEWTVTKEATAFEFGEKVRICSVCGFEEKAQIEKLPVSEVKDEKTGISVVCPDGSYDGEVEIEVSEVFDGTSYNILNAEKGNFKNALFDITTVIDGEKVQPNGSVFVKIPLPDGYNAEKTVVYYITNDGRLEKMDSRVEDGYIVFETTHFSFYAIVDETEKQPENPSENCSCACHKGGIAKLFFKIKLFFQKIFKKNRVCKCGVNHY